MKYDDNHWLEVCDEWRGRLQMAASADAEEKWNVEFNFEYITESNIHSLSYYNEELLAGSGLLFLRGGRVFNIYNAENNYPQGSRYTFRVAAQWEGIIFGTAYWSMRILTHEECTALGFDSVTGKSATYPYINVDGNPEYQAMKQSWEEEQERRAQYAIQYKENFRFSNHWKQVYNLYLKSPEWRIFRWSVRKHYNFTCQRCGIMPPSRDQHVHHLHYETAGAESLDDVTLLCRACHELEHNITEPAS